MSLNAGAGKLSFALKTLRTRWDSTQSYWKDEVRDEFEVTHLKAVEEEVMATLNATNVLSQILLRAQQECT